MNGKLKSKFKIFENRFRGGFERYHILWKIACALTNCFGTCVHQDDAKHMEIARRILEQMPKRNSLQVIFMRVNLKILNQHIFNSVFYYYVVMIVISGFRRREPST